MNANEYLTWTKHAVAAFPSIHRVLDGTAEGRQRSKAWLAALGDVRLEHAVAAIDAMLRGECQPPRFDWAELPACVIRFCVGRVNDEFNTERRRYFDDGPRFRCPHCQDNQSGIVTIWNPRFVADCEAELLAAPGEYEVNEVFRQWRKPPDRKYMSFGAACFCESPSARVRREQRDTWLSFNGKRHCLRTSVKDLHEFLRDEKRIEFDADDWK